MPTYYSTLSAPRSSTIRNGYESPPYSDIELWYAPTVYTSTWDGGSAWRPERQTNSNPNWKQKIAKKQDASTNYLRRETTIESGFLDIAVNFRRKLTSGREFGYQKEFFPVSLSVADPNTITDASLADLALSRLKRKLNNRTQSYNTIIPLAELRELRQTVDGAATTTMKTLIALSDVKKAAKRAIRNVSSPEKLRKALRNAYKDASNIWLTYSFGISPLMGTILDINKSISSYLTRYDSIDRISGSATKSWANHRRLGPQSTCTGAEKYMIVEERFKLEYKFIAGHRFLLESANDYSALDHFGVTPASLIPAAWELTAFSWVVDYFTTAGAFLDDTFTSTTGNSVYAIKNTRLTYSGRQVALFKKAYPTYIYYNFDVKKNIPAKMDSVQFRREVLSSYPPRVLRFRTLDEMGLNGVSKLLNLASVLSKSF